MATTLDDVLNFKAQKKSAPGPAPVPAPQAKPGGHSLDDVLNFKAASAPNQPSLAKRAFESLPGAKGVEGFVEGQENYWSGVGKRLKSEKEDVFGKPGKKGGVQRVLNAWKADPEIQKQLEKWNTPLVSWNPSDSLNPLKNTVKFGQTPEEFKDDQRERARRDKKLEQEQTRAHSIYRGVMEGVGDAVSGLTSPMNLAILIGTEGLGLEAKLAAREAGKAAEAEAGLSAFRGGANELTAEQAAGKAGKEAVGQYNENLKYTEPLAQFTAKKAMQTLMAGGFSAQMITGARQSLHQAEAQFKSLGMTKEKYEADGWNRVMSYEQARDGGMTGGIRSAMDGITNGLFGIGSGLHAVGGGLEMHGVWRNEREVKAALDAGSQETFKKPWKDLTPEEKAKVAYDAVNQYAPEETKKFHRQLQTLQMPPQANDAVTDELFDKAMANREKVFAGNEAIADFLPKTAPKMREFGQGVVETRQAAMDELPNPPKTRLTEGTVLNLPAEREEQRRQDIPDPVRTLELEHSLREQQLQAEKDGAHVESRSTPQALRDQIVAEIESGRLQEQPESPGLRQINDQLESMATGLYPDLKVAAKTEAAYGRLRQAQMRGEQLSDSQETFMRQYANRATLEKQLSGQVPSLQSAYDEAQDQRGTEAARSLVDAAQRLRELNEAAMALKAQKPGSANEAAQLAENLHRARQFAEQRRSQMEHAAAAMEESTPLQPGPPVSRENGRPTKILLPDGRELAAHYARVRIGDIRDRVATPAVIDNYDPGMYLTTDPMAEAGPATILSDGTLVNGGHRINLFDEARKGVDGGRVLRDFDLNLYRFGLESDGIDRSNPEIPVRILDAAPLTTEDLARLRADLDRGPTPVPAPLPPINDVNLQVGEMEDVARALKAMPEGSTLNDLLAMEFGGDLLRKLEEKKVLESTTGLVDEAGALTSAGRDAVERILLKRAIGGDVSNIPKEILDKVAPEMGNLTKIGDGPADWHIGDYLREAMRDTALIGDVRKALDRIGNSSDSAVDKFYRPYDFRRGDQIFSRPPEAPHPITEALVKALNTNPGMLGDYAHAMDDRFGSGELAVSAFNRNVGSKVGVEVAAEDWGTVKAATPEEKAARVEARQPTTPTPEEKAQQANPTKVPAEIRRENAETAVAAGVQAGKVTPESLLELFNTDPKGRFQDWAEDLVFFHDQVVPKATGLSLAQFLKQGAVMGVDYVDEIVINPEAPAHRQRKAQGLAKFLNSAQALIQIAKIGNITTLVHEWFHAMEPHLKVADRATLNVYAVKQVKAAFPYMEEGSPDFLREVAEVKARTWELYLATAEVPKNADNRIKLILSKLKTAFRAFYGIVNGKAPEGSPLRQYKSGPKIKLTPEVAKMFDSYFARDDAKKALLEPPKGLPDAPVIPEVLAPNKAAAAAEKGLQEAKASQQTAEAELAKANEALEAAEDRVKDDGIEGKSPKDMTLPDRIVYDAWRKAQTAANEAAAKATAADQLLKEKQKGTPALTGKADRTIEGRAEMTPADEAAKKPTTALTAPPQKEIEGKAELTPLPVDDEQGQFIDGMHSAMSEGISNATLIPWGEDRDPMKAIAETRRALEASGWKFNPETKRMEKDGWYVWFRSQGNLASPIAQWDRIEATGELKAPPVDIEKPKKAGNTDKAPAGEMKLTQDWGKEINGYSDDPNREEGNPTKDAFLKEGKKYLDTVAAELTKAGFSAHSITKGRRGKETTHPGKATTINEGGPAVSGDVHLPMIGADGKGIYATIGTPGVSPKTKDGVSIMYRAATEKDPYGTRSQNKWAPVDLSASELAKLFKKEADAATKSPMPVGVTIEELPGATIVSDDDGRELAAVAKEKLQGKDLVAAIDNIADQMTDPDEARKELLAISAPPEETVESEVSDGGHEDESARAAGDAEDVSGVPEPAREGGDAPAPVSAEGDQAAAGGENAGPDAGRADRERVEHPGGQPPERGLDGRSDGGSAAADSAAGREGTGAAAAGPGDQRTGADGKPVTTPRPEKPKRAQEKIAEIRNKNNYRISDEYAGTIGSGGEIAKIKGNLDALELLKKLQAEGREVATPEEQATLAKYVDFGGLVGMLQNHWKPEYEKHYERFKKILTPEEIQEIRETLPNTHYTSLKMVDWMWKAMGKMGFKGGRILEPGMGIGNFFGRMPKAIGDRAELYGVERNPLTGSMAKMLYPDARIMVKPFQEVMVPDNSLDTIIGNVPFQDFAVTDDPIYRKLKLNLHNYFIVKSLDKLRPGGIAALITSRYTLDNGTGKGFTAREEMAKRADLIAAIRLPDKAFKGNAGTEVVADLLIFRKRSPNDIPEGVPDWTKLEKVTASGEEPRINRAYGREYIENESRTHPKDFMVSKYFVDHPENVLGTHSQEGKMYGPGQYTVKAPEDFEAALEKAMSRIPANAFGKVKESEVNQPPSTLDPGELNFAPEHVKNGSYYRDKDGTILVKESGVGKKLSMAQNTPVARKHIGDAIDLRDQLNRTIQTQLTSSDDVAMKEQQKSLDKLYETYRKKYGSLNGPALHKLFGDDPEYPKLLALENIDPETKDVSKAAIFTKRVLAPYEPLRDLPEDPKSAMLKVIAEKGNLDTALMAELLKKPEAEVIDNLSKEGLIYRDPRTGNYSTADEYLSGTVREKLRVARQAADADPRFKGNVEALEKVQPKEVTIHEIQPNLGATWIPNEVYAGFIQHLAGGLRADSIHISRDQSGKWLVTLDAVPFDLNNKWGGGGVAGHKLVQFAMNQQQPTVWTNFSDGTREVNQPATTAAREKLAAIKEEFRSVVRRAPQNVVDKLEKIYNDTFGGYKMREFSGEHLTFPGMSEEWRNKIRGYQKASVWRVLQEGRGGVFHAPGLGKTLTMAASGMEARRLKLSRKNMYAVPNNMVPQWREDFKRFYPNASVLAVTDEDFSADNRARLMSRIATGDWDAVIVPHSQFDLLPMSPQWETNTINKRLADYRRVLEDLDEKDDKRTIKQIEKAMDKLESRLNELNDKKKDNTIAFDQLGVDMLFVDEAHAYKAMAVPTKMGNIGGVSNRASQRAFALEMKADFLRDTQGGRGLVFGTGTPITNTVGELYVMNKYLAPELLEEMGIRSFDDWAANFASTITQYEYASDGVTFKAKTTLSEFQNVPELSTMFQRFAEYLSKEAARALSNLKEPEATRHDHMVKITSTQEPLLQMIADRGESLTKNPPKTKEERQADNWLKLSSDARKISLDPRLYDPSLKDDPGSKANTAVKIVKETLDKTKAKKGTVVIFSDFFQHTEGGKADFNLFEDMKQKLLKKGVPAEQIAIIHEATNKPAIDALFQKVRAGKVRVIFGSTEKLGIGVNIQNLLKAELHLDQPWRPDQVEQREGRIVRSGNEWEQVDIHRFIAEPAEGKVKRWNTEKGIEEERDRPRAYDLQMYQQLARKANFQEQFLTGNYRGRTMEDVGGDVKLNSQMFAMGKAMATGNPDAMRKLKIENDLRTFDLLERNFQIDRSKNTRRLDYAQMSVASAKSKLASVHRKMEIFKQNAKRTEEEGWKTNVEIGDAKFEGKELNKLLESNPLLDDWAGKTIKIAGLDTQIERGITNVPVKGEAYKWEEIENFSYTDARGEKADIPRNKNNEQTFKAMVSQFLNRAGTLSDVEHRLKGQIEHSEEERDNLTKELTRTSPYIEKIETMEKEVQEINQRMGMTGPAEQDEGANVEEEAAEGAKSKKAKAADDELYQEALPNLSVLTREEQQSEIVAADGNLQDHMADAKVKEFGSVEEGQNWLVNAAQGDKYSETFHGSQVRQTPDGRGLVLYAPKNPDVLYQDEPPEQNLAELRRLRDEAMLRLRISPFRDAAQIKRDQDFLNYADKKLGTTTPGLISFTPLPENVDARKQPGAVESIFPEEAKRAGIDVGRRAADDNRRVRDAGGVPPVAERADGTGDPGQTGGPGLRGGSDRGVGNLREGPGRPGGRGVPEPAGSGGVDTPFIRMRPPTRPRGAETISPAQWQVRTKQLKMPGGVPPPTVTIDPDIASVLQKFPGQLEAVEVMQSALEQYDGAIMAMPTGSGKTFMGLALAKQNQTPKSRIFIVTKSRNILKQRNGWRDAGKKYFDLDLEWVPNRKKLAQGIAPGIYAGTYAELAKKKALTTTPWDLVLFDESAEARRWHSKQSKQGLATKELSDVAKKAVYVSAAPYHSAVEMGYMTKLGVWKPGEFDEWAMREMGARKKAKKAVRPGGDTEEWGIHGSDPKKLIAFRDQMIKRGQFITQELSMDGHTTDIALVQTSEHQRLQIKAIREVFESAERFYDNKGQSRKATRARALGAIYTKNYLERLKIPQMIELAKSARKQGWDVAMFSENKVEVQELWDYLKQADQSLRGELERKLPKLPGVFEELEKELGKDEIANYSGPETGKRADMAEAFRNGEKHYMYATYAAGGVGVSFHDDNPGGVRPKLVIHLGLPWSGMMFNQAQGRFWRYGTESNVHSIFLVGDSHPEVDLILKKVMPRLNSIHASVRGLDGEDPLVKGMQALTKAEAYHFEQGFRAKYDIADYEPVKGQIPIKDWAHAKSNMPSAEEAKGKGMKYAATTPEAKIQNRLFQEAQPIAMPDRFLSPEEAQAQLDTDEMMDAFAEGEAIPVVGDEARDIEPGDRLLLADQVKAAVADKVSKRGAADAKAAARNATRNELTNIMAAKWAGEAGAVREPKPGEPGWVMKGEAPEEDPKVKAKKTRIMSAILSGMENIKALTKKAGVPEIGHQIDINQRNYRAWRNQYAGELTSKLQDVLKENKIAKDEIRQVWLAKEGKMAPANPRIAKAVQGMTKLMNEIRQMAADRGINLNDYDEDGRAVQISYGDIKDNPNYMPHIFDYSEKIKVIDPKTGEEETFTLKELLGNKDLPTIRRERIVNGIVAKFGKEGWTKERVERWIDEKKRKTPLAGNIERARTADLPFYRMDQGALIKYFTGTGEVFARTEQHGQDLGKLEALISQIPDKTIAKSVRNIMMDSLAPEPWSEWASDFYSVVTTAQVVTKMAFSPLKVPFHLVHTGLVMEQFRPLLKAILQVPGGWKGMKQFGLMSGSIQDGVTSQFNMDLASKLNLSHKFLQYTGFNWLFEADRVIGAQTARNWMSDYLLPELIKKSKAAPRAREKLTDTLLIHDKQIDEAVKRGRWTEDDFKHAGAAFTNRVMFTGDPTELPYLWRARSPGNPMVDNFLIVARVSTALKSFEFKSAMLLKRALIDEAKKGNFRAWIPFLVIYPLAGTALRATTAAVHAGLGDPRSLNNLEKEIDDLFDDPTIGKAAHFWLDSVAHATAQSMVSHVLDVLFFPPKEKRKAQFTRGKLMVDELKEVLGPYGDLWSLGETLIKIAASGHDDLTSDEEDSISKFLGHSTKDALDLSGELVPLARPYVPTLEEALGVSKKKTYEMAPPP